jgi:hypothetical protein
LCLHSPNDKDERKRWAEISKAPYISPPQSGLKAFTYGRNDSYSNIIIMSASSGSSSRLGWNFDWNGFKFSWPWLPI